ncbi:MAG TPA: dihydropteroate synthase [Syntrophomonadaceae bacterium]|nr:dihydropteroate synthase [Syntrophomonadaceae bacterium]
MVEVEKQNGHNLRVVLIKNQEDAKQALAEVGTDQPGARWMAPKAVHRVIRIKNLNSKAANILKQEMLSRGGEAALSRGVGNFSVEETDCLLMGTLRQYDGLCKKLKMQPFGLRRLADGIKKVLDNYDKKEIRTLPCRDLSLTLGERTLVMGILNVTPDSFSDGGKFYDPEVAIDHAHEMVEDGADIIDLGGESTRPITWNEEPLSAAEEIQRIIPVLERLLQEIKVPISIDTYKAETARAALEAGAHIINDIWGFQRDPKIAAVAAEYDVPVVLMHNQDGTEYQDMMGELLAFLRRSIDIAVEAGVQPNQVIVDPGIGFGKDVNQNRIVMRCLRELRSLGKPILLGTSRKSMIGKTLNLPADQRLEGSLATVVWGIAQGAADIVRVHDVKETVRAVRMTDAIVSS